MVSIIIPARNEKYLDKTVEDIRAKATGEIEVIVIKDKLMRTAINEGVAQAKGKYIMKLDAHCMLDKGFDEKLIADHQDNWVQIPRRKRLDPEKWELIEKGWGDIDYMYLGKDLMGRIDFRKSNDPKFKTILIDNIESFQGSCYFITKDYFNKLGLLDDKNFGGSGNESQEITFKVWHDGGRVVRNKKTWYAHAHTNRGYSRKNTGVEKSRKYIIKLAEQYGYKKD